VLRGAISNLLYSRMGEKRNAYYYYFIFFNCNWAYVRWQCYKNWTYIKEMDIHSKEKIIQLTKNQHVQLTEKQHILPNFTVQYKCNEQNTRYNK
jgi:hypothetical protein